MKYLKEALIYVCSFIITVTCLTKLTFQDVKDPSINKIVLCVYSSLDMNTVARDNGEKLKKLYGINPKEIDSFAFFSPKSNMDANEFLVIRKKSASNSDQIIKKIDEHLKQQEDTFRDYAPKQYGIIKKSIVDKIGKYIIVVVSPKAKLIKNKYDKEF